MICEAYVRCFMMALSHIYVKFQDLQLHFKNNLLQGISLCWYLRSLGTINKCKQTLLPKKAGF